MVLRQKRTLWDVLISPELVCVDVGERLDIGERVVDDLVVNGGV
jgi:hypothetical protein